jgi:CBS domain-containing protein
VAAPIPAGGPVVTAAEIMTREVLTTRPEVPVKELAKRLSYHRISGMPVVDADGVVLGVVSEADLISKRGATVADIMTAPVISVTEEMPAVEVAALLTQERIKRVPVLRDGRLVGLIGRSNVVSWAAGQVETAGQAG